ncbi:Cytochrome c oxidase assembly protein cox18, mitochondrial [Tyrophagus putrescentiae]|nr:Cytochrome c oxidase assembly protein cox18, mitochondrial [Tyrophagus putrescentiae]
MTLQWMHFRKAKHILQSPVFSVQARANASFLSAFSDINSSIANSAVLQFTKDSLISFHEWSHLPWFAEIALVTIAARCLIAFPLTVNQRRIITRPKVRDEAYLVGRSKKGTNAVYRRELTKEINRLIVRDNCHPTKAAMVPLFQIPMWIILSHSYRNLARLYPNPADPASLMAFSQLQQEGILWFHDLTVPDPTGILPVATALVNLTIIQLHVNERRRNKLQDSFFIKFITNGGRLFSLIIVPIGLVMPADMSYYWLISSSVGLLQNILLMNPKFKTMMNINTPVTVGSGNKV